MCRCCGEGPRKASSPLILSSLKSRIGEKISKVDGSSRSSSVDEDLSDEPEEVGASGGEPMGRKGRGALCVDKGVKPGGEYW
jgi:hypothetical protein